MLNVTEAFSANVRQHQTGDSFAFPISGLSAHQSQPPFDGRVFHLFVKLLLTAPISSLTKGGLDSAGLTTEAG